MDFETVASSTIQAMAYDPDTLVMGIIFKNGSEYHYDDVPPATYSTVRNAVSIGAAFAEHVKKAGFKFTRIR
jgi:hypothetical protein